MLACCIAVSKLESAVRQSEDVPHVHHHRHHHAAGAKTCNKTQQHPAAFDPTQAPVGHKDTQPDACMSHYNHADMGTAADGPVLAAAEAPVSEARQAQFGDLVSLDSIKGPLMASVDGLFGLWSASSSG